MKIYIHGTCLVIIILLLANTGCKKDAIDLAPNHPGPPNTFVPDTAPYIYAGGDFFVWSPLNEAHLSGSYSPEDSVSGMTWAKISGPGFYVIENIHSLSTKVTGLEKGAYQFELTVTNIRNLYSKDTIVVTVGEMSANPKEVIFKDLVVVCPWDCNVGITNIYSHLPAGTVFKVYVQRDNSASWEEAVPALQWTENDPYLFDLNNGNLLISGFGGDEKPGIKIIY